MHHLGGCARQPLLTFVRAQQEYSTIAIILRALHMTTYLDTGVFLDVALIVESRRTPEKIAQCHFHFHPPEGEWQRLACTPCECVGVPGPGVVDGIVEIRFRLETVVAVVPHPSRCALAPRQWPNTAAAPRNRPCAIHWLPWRRVAASTCPAATVPPGTRNDSKTRQCAPPANARRKSVAATPVAARAPSNERPTGSCLMKHHA